jgi:hypothetical protein
MNDYALTTLLENKAQTRLWFSDCVPLPPFSVMEGCHINLALVQQRFPEYTQFVVQADSSCSGNGTWLFTENTESEILSRINMSSSYTVSPYICKSIPINVHLVIYEQEIVMLPPSIQIISTAQNMFNYKGADFIAYRQIAPSIRDKVIRYATIIGNRLRIAGYRGVCGIDFITDGHETYFMEVNSRFQSSTMLINRALNSMEMEISVQQLHMDAFDCSTCSYNLPVFDVNFSFRGYSYHENNRGVLKHLYTISASCSELVVCIDDYLDWSMQLQPECYLFAFIFQHNIIAISPEHTCILHPNVDLCLELINAENWVSKIQFLKIMLLNHGIRINAAAEYRLLMAGGLNYKEFEAIDLVIQDWYFNVPYGTWMSRFSPFEICLDDYNDYILCYWGKPLTGVILRTQDPFGSNKLDSGFRFDQIAYLGQDRLRIYHRHSCHYQQSQLGCGFCDIESNERQFTFDDIKFVIDAYAEHPSIRHYMIGGGSNSYDCDFSYIIDIAAYIRHKTNKSINLMSTPPHKHEILVKLYQVGINEVTFNLEVFDRNIANRYMPGKGAISLYEYEKAFVEAVNLWGSDGNVRTAFIIGLEPKESLLRGIDFVCKLGVWPILSLLKPVEGTPLAHMLPPSDEDVFAICREVEAICQYHDVGLAPTCRCCEDNTLKITL